MSFSPPVTGSPSDFMPSVSSLTFLPTTSLSPQTKCTLVDIINDNVVEETEQFTVVLEKTSDHRIVLAHPTSTTIDIIDSDGKRYIFREIQTVACSYST